MPREVEARFHVIERQGRRPLYRAVIGGPDVRGMRKSDYFRFKTRTAAGGFSAEFVSKLLERRGEEAVMVTVPPGIVEASGLKNAATVMFQLVGPASAREAAEAAGKGREFIQAHQKRLQRRVAGRRQRLDAVRKRVVPSRKPEAAPTHPVEPSPLEPVSVTLPPPEPTAPETPQTVEEIDQLLPAPSKPEPETIPLPRPVVESPSRVKETRKIMKQRQEVPEDAVSRVRDTVVAMEKKLIYLHLVPEIVLGQLKTKRQIDEAVDAVFRDVAAVS
jgi:hypothetical protein